MKTVTCLLRNISLIETPEEKVRQETLHYLISTALFPRHLIAVEVALSSLCSPKKVPNRRIDIACFFPHKNSLFPLLLIECKKAPPNEKETGQLQGYNFFLKSPFIGFSWPNSISIWKENSIFYDGSVTKIPKFQNFLS